MSRRNTAAFVAVLFNEEGEVEAGLMIALEEEPRKGLRGLLRRNR